MIEKRNITEIDEYMQWREYLRSIRTKIEFYNFKRHLIKVFPKLYRTYYPSSKFKSDTDKITKILNKKDWRASKNLLMGEFDRLTESG